MKMLILWIVCGILLQITFAVTENHERYMPALFLKGAASFCFVCLGLACLRSDDVFGRWIIVGLIFGMLGDILLNLRYVIPKAEKKIFLIGILAFLVGHIMYLIALIQRSGSGFLIPALVGTVLAAGFLKIIFSVCRVELAFKIFGIFYVGAVTWMAVYGIWDWWKLGGTTLMLFAVGGVLFLVSDLVLIFNTFRGGEPKLSLRMVNLSMYYLGQLFIAGSLLYLR